MVALRATVTLSN